MLGLVLAIFSTSYVAWYFESFEMAAVYPFDETYSTPEEAGAPAMTERRFDTQDGARLVVWEAAPEAGRPTVFYLSGNAGSLTDRAPRFATLTDAGLGVFAPAYRGSSGSTGTPEETLLVGDAAALARSLDGPVVLYGESLGAAVAIRLAAMGVGDALVLEAPFTSIPDLVAAQYPAEDLRSLITQTWDSLASVGEVTQPLLVIHGEADRIVPIEMGRRVFQKAGSKQKRLLAVPDHGHTALWTMDVRSELMRFLGRGF